MYAVTIDEGTLSWREHPDPVPGKGEVLVSVEAAGLNAADLLQRRGLYPAPPGWPQDIPGMEVAGTVVGLGDGAGRFAVGDRVMALCGGGGQAELVAVPESALMAVPGGVASVVAGGFPEAFCTAHDALVTQARLASGQRVVVTGAAGGVGTAAVQLASALGAEVVASVRTAEHRDEVRRLGAGVVVAPDAVGEHGPYDVSLELVGGPGVAAVVPHLSLGGRIVVIGVGAGAKVEINLLALMGSRSSIRGSTLRARTTEEKAEVIRLVEAYALPRLASGELTVPIEATYPLPEAEAAYERFGKGGKLGKVVLVGV